MKIVETIYALWPIWVLATLILTPITYRKMVKHGLEASSIASAGTDSLERRNHERKGMMIAGLVGIRFFILFLLLTAIFYHCHLYLF